MAKKLLVGGVTGLSDSYHDNSFALVVDGTVAFAASEERYSRIKHDKHIPARTIDEALRATKVKPETLSWLAVGYPKRFFLRPFISKPSAFVDVLRLWIHGRKWQFLTDAWSIFSSEVAQNGRSRRLLERFTQAAVVYVDHHRAHAASAYLTSGFDQSLTLVLDAFGTTASGEFLSGAVYTCRDARVPAQPVQTIGVAESIGLFYTAVTMALGFTPGDGEGKTMGLAAYGDDSVLYEKLRRFAPHFVRGSWIASPYWAQQFFANRKSFLAIFNALPIGQELASLVKTYGSQDVAAAAQRILEEEVLKYVACLSKRYDVSQLSLAGGVFLNVKLSQKIRQIPGVKSVYIHPNAGDGGTALGAALAVYADQFGLPNTHSMLGANLGSEYSETDILAALKKYGKAVTYKKHANIAKKVARRLVDGVVVGWFQGRFEWGPRALGFRSVVIDPRRMDIKEKLNLTLKNREWFMPFAPSVLDEHGAEYFEQYCYSPYMTLAFDVVRKNHTQIAAATHIDQTARPNSVTKQNNPLYYKMISEFYRLTGVPVVLNTSFNKHGLPIINTPEDAIDHLLWNCIEELALGDYYVERAH